MGLDMYLLKAEKPNLDENKVYSHGVLEAQGYSCFPADENDEPHELLSDLKPFLQRMRLETDSYDFDKIQREFNMANTPSVSCISPAETTFYCYTPSPQYVTIKREDIDRFIKCEISVFYVTKLQEIGYWRKEYDLEEKIYDAFKKRRNIAVQNCGYYRVDNEMLQMINEYNAKHDLDEILPYASDEANGIFYHEWY